MSREAQGNLGLGGWRGEKQKPGSELLRAGQRWFCTGADVSLEGWVLTGKEKGGDGKECWDEGSITVMLKFFMGAEERATSIPCTLSHHPEFQPHHP